MVPIIENLATSAASTVNSKSIQCTGPVKILTPSAHDGTTTDFDTATGYVQYKDDKGDFVDYTDGSSNEQITGAGDNKAVDADGLEIRVQLRSVSGSTVIPRIFVAGNTGQPIDAIPAA